MTKKGFTIIELLVVMGIIALLAGIVTASVLPALAKSRDSKRKIEISQIGKFLSASGNCYLPNSGPGDYDLADLFSEVKSKFPQAASIKLPRDPKTGSETHTNYRYLVNDQNQCLLYANLENTNEKPNLSGVFVPTLGKGTGIYQANSNGPNGTNIYFQYSK